MSTSRIRRMLAGVLGSLALTVTALSALPGTAHADGGCNYTNFCAYSDDYRYTYQTPGNSNNWPSQVKNRVDWVHNNGNPNTPPALVDIFWGNSADGFGAYACIGYGDAWNLRTDNYRFTWYGYHGSAGHRQNVHDNAAAHHWVHGPCGHYNDSF